MKVNELVQAKLSPDSEAYKRVYDLLEEHTASWITDAWKKHPTLDAIQRQPLYPVTLEQMLAIRGVDPQKARVAHALRERLVMLNVNGTKACVLSEVADQIFNALAEHAT